MNAFQLKIVTPDGPVFDGMAQQLTLRTTGGEVGILAGHIDYVAALGMGQAVVTAEGKRRVAACMGGMVSVKNGAVTLVPTTFEWADQIDPNRAERSMERAQQVLKKPDASDLELKLAQARLRRALVRRNVHDHR